MEYETHIFGEYVLTPCKNAFNNKTSYWLSKEGYWLSVYAFTPMDKRDLAEHLTMPAVSGYIQLFEDTVSKLNQ